MNVCACGYEAGTAVDLADHLAEAFSADDDVAPDGHVHAEAWSPGTRYGKACLCGFRATDAGILDTHLLAVFTPPDHVGRDGLLHADLAGH
jgi:hypothetical protein